MNHGAILGLLVAVTAIVGAQALHGEPLGVLWNSTAILIVLGGTTGAVLVQYPFSTVRRSVRMACRVIVPAPRDLAVGQQRLVSYAQMMKQHGFLALEAQVIREPDPFLRKGLLAVVDCYDPATVRSVMEIHHDHLERDALRAAKPWESAGGYAPVFGIIGAVLGLMQVMGHLDSPWALGAGIAQAFVATLYGLAIANLVCLPIAHHLRAVVMDESAYREMILEGVLEIARGQTPRRIHERLGGFLPQPWNPPAAVGRVQAVEVGIAKRTVVA